MKQIDCMCVCVCLWFMYVCFGINFTNTEIFLEGHYVFI